MVRISIYKMCVERSYQWKKGWYKKRKQHFPMLKSKEKKEKTEYFKYMKADAYWHLF